MLRPERATVLATWIRHAQERRDDDFWAWDWVNSQVNWEATAEDAWVLVVELLRAAPDEVLGNVAAGPLEHLVEPFELTLEQEAAIDAELAREVERGRAKPE